MKATTNEGKKTRQRKEDGVYTSVVSDDSPRRTERGYHWEITTRVGGKRIARKFFKHGKSAEKTAYVEEQKALINQHGAEEREQALDTNIQKELTAALEILSPWGKSLTEAATFYANHLETKANEDSSTIEQGITVYLDSMRKRELDPKTINRARQTLHRFSDSFPDRTLASLEGEEIQLWWERLEGIVNQRANRIDVNTFLNWCARSPQFKGFKVNPTPPPPSLPKKRAPKKILSASEVRRLLNAADSELLPAIVAQVFLGVRKEESLRLRWDHFDWQEETLNIPPEVAKGAEGHARINEIPHNALQWLKPYMNYETGRVLKTIETLSGYDNSLQKLREKAGWNSDNPWPRNALRRTYISNHYASFDNVGLTAKNAGTSEAVIFRNYRAMVKKSAAKKLWEIYPKEEGNVIQLSTKGA